MLPLALLCFRIILLCVHFLYSCFLWLISWRALLSQFWTPYKPLSFAAWQKFPSHVAVAFPSELVTAELLALFIGCCVENGVTELTLFDAEGKAKAMPDAALASHPNVLCFKPNFTRGIDVSNLGSRSLQAQNAPRSRGYSSRCHITLLSGVDAMQPLIDSLILPYSSSHPLCAPVVSPDQLQPTCSIKSEIFLSYLESSSSHPDLLLTVGPNHCLYGFPSWLLRTAELGHLVTPSTFSIKAALVRYASSEQRLGK